MSDEVEVGTTNDGSQPSGGGKMRKQLEEALAQNKQLAEELSTYRAEKRQATVSELFQARGVPVGAAKFYTDTDVSEASVDKWLKDNEGVFGPARQPDQRDNSPEANSARRVADASFSQPDGDPLSDAAKALGDPEELMNLINTAPDEELERLGILPKSQGRNVVKGGYVEPSPAQYLRRR